MRLTLNFYFVSRIGFLQALALLMSLKAYLGSLDFFPPLKYLHWIWFCFARKTKSDWITSNAGAHMYICHSTCAALKAVWSGTLCIALPCSFENDWRPHPLASKAEIKVPNIVGLTWLRYHAPRITVKPPHIQACLFEDDVNAMLKENDERRSCWWVRDEHAGIVEPSWPHLPLPREPRSQRVPHYFKPCILYDVFLATMILGSQL